MSKLFCPREVFSYLAFEANCEGSSSGSAISPLMMQTKNKVKMR